MKKLLALVAFPLIYAICFLCALGFMLFTKTGWNMMFNRNQDH